jgi:hypothetical protein
LHQTRSGDASRPQLRKLLRGQHFPHTAGRQCEIDGRAYGLGGGVGRPLGVDEDLGVGVGWAFSHTSYGRGGSVGRGLGVGLPLGGIVGVAVGGGVNVAVAVAVAVGVGV